MQWRIRIFAVLALLALASALAFFLDSRKEEAVSLTITAGSPLGRRHELAEILSATAAQAGVQLRVVPTEGSRDAVERVADGTLDFALIQGGRRELPGLMQVASLYPEPLHLLVREGIDPAEGLAALRGKRVSLSTQGSGTRALSATVLDFIGFKAGADYTDLALSYENLEALPPEELPDAAFMVSSLPSPVAQDMIARYGYRLMPIPLGESLALRDYAVTSARIPAFAYGAVPPMPPQDVQTVANRLLLVAHESVSPEAAKAILEILYDGRFARAADLHDFSDDGLLANPEYPVHPGTMRYAERNLPLLTSDRIEFFENLRSFLVSIAVALFLLWRWSVSRNANSFEKYLSEVTALERRALEIESQATLDLGDLMQVRTRLSVLKSEALEQFAEGKLKGEELMSSFLTHVSDVRNYVNALILHARENLEKEARRRAEKGASGEAFKRLWDASVGDESGVDKDAD
ncbi:MAG: TAXI family TRAP transporter solute-binding subunit [Candidatus Sumerlaeia bacterium]|nr:TAXI family TRAP transporter solute-binding subunit [Candidatus Sumerlaeia bacterium]